MILIAGPDGIGRKLIEGWQAGGASVTNARRTIGLLIFVVAGLLAFQSCGDVHLRAPGPESQVSLSSQSTTYLKIDPIATTEHRAVFVIDVSNSMFSGACPDSLDTMIPNVKPSINCLGPTGVDPEGNRFQILLNWISDLEEKVNKQILTDDQVKVLILPFASAGLLTQSTWSLARVNQLAGPLGYAFPDGFVDLATARRHVHFLWAMEAKYHDSDMSPLIPLEIRNRVDAAVGPTNVNASTGTSVVAPALDAMNAHLLAELAKLKAANQLSTSHFEIHFLSDGVPTPHALHIEGAVNYIWNSKDLVCDPTIYPVNANCRNSSDAQAGWMTVNAQNCASRCGDYLKTFAETGSVSLPPLESPVCATYFSIPYSCSGYSDGSTPTSRWSSQIKCGQCFELVSQFAYTKNSGTRTGLPITDSFKAEVSRNWGDWQLNRHVNIIQKLKTTANIFRIQFPGPMWRMNFHRIDSPDPIYKTQAAELNKNLNWIEKARDYFFKGHVFTVVTTNQPPFALFSELETLQRYQLGMIYVYNRSYQMKGDRTFVSNANSRSDGKCLDAIKNNYSECVSIGCSFQIDRDGDGLNQCEEATLGTDDFDPDSDGDGLLDGSEVLYNLNPLSNDQTLSSNSDGFTNFEHFIRGYSPVVNLNAIPLENQIAISARLVDTKLITDARSLQTQIPGYEISLQNLPLNPSTPNEIVVVARVDNYSNANEKRWLSHIYILAPGAKSVTIQLEDLSPLQLGAP